MADRPLCRAETAAGKPTRAFALPTMTGTVTR
jgi:hypothetical protein